VIATDKNIAFVEEIATEVRNLIAIHEDKSFRERVAEFSEAVRVAIAGEHIKYDTSKAKTIDACDTELNKVFRVSGLTRKYLFALRIHQGYLWLRQQEIAADDLKKGSFSLTLHGEMDLITDISKFKKYQLVKYSTHRDEVSRSITLARISKYFPEIIHSEKKWSWFRSAITNDKLANEIKKQKGIVD